MLSTIIQQFRHLLPARAFDAHKGDFGHVLIIGGDNGMPGAVRLAGEAALRMGCGSVTTATRPQQVAAIIANRPELMSYSIETAHDLIPLLQRATFIVLGSGLGRSEWSKELFACAIQTNLPMLIDGDGLFWLAQFELYRKNWILTPHLGEAAHLLNTDIAAIQTNRLGALGLLQQQYAGTVVLKGANTLILDDRHQIFTCPFGNPGMATAGMGDVLSGMIAGLAAQAIALESAAQLGVSLHALAGDEIARQFGQPSLLATDVLNFIPTLFAKFYVNTTIY